MPNLRPSTRWSLTGLGILGTVAAATIGWSSFDAQQRRWIFQASAIRDDVAGATGGATTAAWTRNDGFEHVWIDFASRTSGAPVRLHALWLAAVDPKAPTMLYLHGSRRNVEQSGFRIRQMQALGFSVLALDYRGFGRSTDELPSEASVDEDARAGWRWLEGRAPGRDRYIFGHSLGGAIAVRLATEVPDAKGLIVEGTFTSIADVFKSFRFGWLPVGPLITQRFDSIEKIAKVKVPVLVVHGSDDGLIPPALGRQLFDRATAPKRFVLVDGGTHYSTNRVGEAQYREALHALFGLGG